MLLKSSLSLNLRRNVAINVKRRNPEKQQMNIMAIIAVFDDLLISIVCGSGAIEKDSTGVVVVVRYSEIVVKNVNIVFAIFSVDFDRIRDVVGDVLTIRCVVPEINEPRCYFKMNFLH